MCTSANDSVFNLPRSLFSTYKIQGISDVNRIIPNTLLYVNKMFYRSKCLSSEKKKIISNFY